MFLDAHTVLIAGLTFLIFLLLGAALALILMSLRRPTLLFMSIAAGLVAIATIMVVVVKSELYLVNWAALMLLALLGIIVAVLGGNPITRVVLNATAKDRVRETADGGITLPGEGAKKEGRTVMRGGVMIGYLERTAITLTLIAGIPMGIVAVIAVKGIGRFSEMDAPEARERFIVGTISSLVWACVLGVLVRMVIA